MTRYWLDEGVVLRLGAQSALAFRPRDGLRLRLNGSGGRYLAALHGRTPREAWDRFRERCPAAPPAPDDEASRVRWEALRLGLLTPLAKPGNRIVAYDEPAPPEVVHLLVTDRCNYRCASCYAGNAGAAAELSLAELKRLADELAALGVLELALGGGEPLLRSDLAAFVAHAARRMVVNVTTNGSRLTLARAIALKAAGINLVQVSLNGPDEATNALSREAGTWEAAVDALATLDLAGVRSGVNIVVTRALLGRLAETLEFLARFAPYQIVLVRPKPAARDDAWFAAHGIPRAAFAELAREVRALPWRFPGLLITVDSTFGPLFHDLPAEHLRRHGFRGLAGGVTSCCVAADGAVYPGSHFVAPRFRAGSVREQRFAAIWAGAAPLATFRELPAQLAGACGRCELRETCNGGCRKTALIEGGLYHEDRQCVRATAG